MTSLDLLRDRTIENRLFRAFYVGLGLSIVGMLAAARSRERASNGDGQIGYEVVAPLNAYGRLMADLWKAHRDHCCVRRFHAGEHDRLGRLSAPSRRPLVFRLRPRSPFRAHGLRSFEWNILRFVGIRPVHKTLIGNVVGSNPTSLEKWLDNVRELGQEGR